MNYVQMVAGRMKQEHHFAILVTVATIQEEKELSVTMNVVSLYASDGLIDRMVPVTWFYSSGPMIIIILRISW